MREKSVTILICLTVGLSLVYFARPIARWFCGYMKDLWKVHDDDMFAKGLEGAV